MNKKSKWLLVLSLATTITGSGIVMAASTADQQSGDTAGTQVRPLMAHHMDCGGKQQHKEMLELLKIDEATFKSEMEAGKTLGQIAVEHGVSEQAVIDLVQQNMLKRIDEGVKAGRLTVEQAEKMKANAAQRAEQMVKSAPGPRDGKHGGFGHHGMGPDHQALLELLKIDDAALRDGFKAGKTLGQIAVEHGVSEQAVIDLVQQNMLKHIDEGVKAGRLTAEQAEKMKADAAQRAEQMVKSAPGPRDGKHGGFGHHGMGPDHQALLELLKIDDAALRDGFKAGKTLGQIAGEHGVSEQAVIDLVQQNMIKHIDEGVKAGRLTAEQAEKMKADAAQRAEQMVKSAPGPRDGKHGGFGHDGMGPEQQG